MTIEEIRKGAPLGTTHYRYDAFDNLRYLKINADGGHLWCDYDSDENRWREISYINLDNLDFYIKIDEIKPL